jgi:hypothetical protein
VLLPAACDNELLLLRVLLLMMLMLLLLLLLLPSATINAFRCKRIPACTVRAAAISNNRELSVDRSSIEATKPCELCDGWWSASRAGSAPASCMMPATC